MALHVTDGDIWEIAPDMPTALSWCSESISMDREIMEAAWAESQPDQDGESRFWAVGYAIPEGGAA